MILLKLFIISLRFVQHYDRKNKENYKFRAITLARLIGGTIWGCHFTTEANFTTDIIYVFHYVLFKSMKQNRDNDNSRAIILARLMGGTVCGRHFDQTGTLNNWYYWSLSLFHYILSKNMKKWEMHQSKKTGP